MLAKILQEGFALKSLHNFLSVQPCLRMICWGHKSYCWDGGSNHQPDKSMRGFVRLWNFNHGFPYSIFGQGWIITVQWEIFRILKWRATLPYGHLVGGLGHSLFFQVYGIVIPTDQCFWEGLKPPTSHILWGYSLVQLRLKGMEFSAVPLLASSYGRSPEPMHDYTLAITVGKSTQPELGKEVRKILSQICCRLDTHW